MDNSIGLWRIGDKRSTYSVFLPKSLPHIWGVIFCSTHISNFELNGELLRFSFHLFSTKFIPIAEPNQPLYAVNRLPATPIYGG